MSSKRRERPQLQGLWLVAANGLALSVFACDPGGPDEPEAVEVPVSITAASDISPEGPLRLAVTWRSGSGANRGWITTFDAPVTEVNATQTAVLQLPPQAVRPSLRDRSEVYVSCGSDTAYIMPPVVLPRLVVYQDVDGSGDFNPNLPGNPGNDRVWGASRIDSSIYSITAFEDLDRTLSTVPTEFAECIRGYTQGRYTSFFMAVNYSSYVTPDAEPLAADVPLSPTDFARVTLGCPGNVAAPSDYYSDVVVSAQVALVDNPVKDDVCATATYSCLRDDVGQRLPASTDNVDYPGFIRTFECTAVGSLDVLWETETQLVCDQCSCSYTESDSVWVVDTAQQPANWPCGSNVDYCGTPQQSVWVRPSFCAVTTKRPL